MEDVFIPQSLNIKNLFGNSDSLFQVPDYQRPYSWEDDQVEALWEDIQDAYNDGEKNYFLGSVITVPDNTNGYQNIVDGQQRITTLMILFCVIRDMYPEINQNQEDNSKIIKLTRLEASINDVDKRLRLKLLTHDRDQNDFKEIIMKQNATKNINKKPSKKEIAETPISKFSNTAHIFKDKIKDLGAEKTGQFINYLFNNVKVIKITCKNRDFAIKLFQILNDRGKDLTSSDLIKTYLMSPKRLLKENRPSFKQDWNRVMEMATDVDMSIDDLFVLYEYYLLADNPKKSLHEEIEKYLKDKEPNPNTFINSFRKFCGCYKHEIFNSKNKTIYSLRYLPWERYWKAILLTAKTEEFKNYDELSKELRNFYYKYWIAGKTLTKIKQPSFNVIKRIKEGESLDSIKDELKKKIEKDNINSQVLESLKGEVDSERWIKPLLLMIEYKQEDNSNPNFIKWNNKLHLEHILPKKYETFPEWNHITAEVEKKFLHSIGNLTLLSGRKNIEASNNPFKTKLDIYRGKGKYGDKEEGITGFEITQKISDDVTNKDITDWNEKSMKLRWNWFLNQIESLLDIDCTKIKQKLDDQNTDLRHTA